MKILLVEDDKPLAKSLSYSLSRQYAIDLAFTGESALNFADTNRYDLAVIDITLPDFNGIDLCSQLRDLNLKLPILMLTGEDSIVSKVNALENGADDYLTKPFSMEELKARLHALLRRPSTYKPNILKAGNLIVNTLTHTVRRNNQTIRLRRKEFALLAYFLNNQGKVITRTMMLDHIWDSQVDAATNTVDVHIKTLRDKIDRPFKHPLIKTVYGLGYKLEA